MNTSPIGSPPAERAPSRREQILEAALELFLERGVAATSMEEIRRRSGASIGSIYHHFDSKEAIAATLFLEGLRGYQQGFLEVLEREAAARAGVQAAVRHHLEWVIDQPGLSRYLFTSRETDVELASRPAVRELNGAFLARVAAWVAPRMRRGELRELPVELLHALWLGPAHELARHWSPERPAADRVALAAALEDAAWLVLRAQT